MPAVYCGVSSGGLLREERRRCAERRPSRRQRRRRGGRRADTTAGGPSSTDQLLGADAAPPRPDHGPTTTVELPPGRRCRQRLCQASDSSPILSRHCSPRTNCLTHRTTASSWTIYPWTCSSEYLPPYNASAKSSSTEVADTDAVQARVMSTPSLHICPLQTFAPGQSPAPDICLSRTIDPRIFAAPEHPPPNICRHTMPLPSLRRRRFQMAMRYRSG